MRIGQTLVTLSASRISALGFTSSDTARLKIVSYELSSPMQHRGCGDTSAEEDRWSVQVSPSFHNSKEEISRAGATAGTESRTS